MWVIVFGAALISSIAGAWWARERSQPAGSRVVATSVSNAPIASAPQGHSAPTRVVTLEIGGMVCSGCVAKISRQLSITNGVRSADVSLDQQRATVVCDESVADTALTAAVRRAGPEYLGLVLKK